MALLGIGSCVAASPVWALQTQSATISPQSGPGDAATGLIATNWQLGDGGFRPAIEAAAPSNFVDVASAAESPVAGPSPPVTDGQAAVRPEPDPRYRSFIGRVGAVKWEFGAALAVMTAINVGKVNGESQPFRFSNEGLFGKDTANLGLDKLAHAYNTYLLSEIFYRRMERKTGGGLGSAVTAAVLGSGLQIYAEVFDGFHRGAGFSAADVGFNVGGAAFSVLRNSVPGLKEKLDFRIMIVPNDDFYTFQGKKHFEQEHFLLALKLAGFEKLRNGPLRFLELHVGYHAKDFTIPDRLAGIEPKRLPFMGVGFNFAELFRTRRSWIAKAARTTLQYVQVPYTSIHVDLPTGRLSP